MNAAVVAAVVLLFFYFFGFRFYSRFLAQRVWHIVDDEPTPAHRFADGVDYVPTRKSVLFGHHFTSIAGAAPIVGPAIAVIWGWLPALLWVVLGTLLMGAVHDFGCLVLSSRHEGRSMGDVASSVINPRTRTLFLLIIFFLIFFVLAVFAFVIATLFVQYPSSVIPINFQIVVAVLIGYLIHRRGIPILWPSIVALILLYGAVLVGLEYPISVPPMFGTPVNTWIFFLLIYAFLASVLPVWLLLQPRDFINSHQLLVGLGLMFAGLFIMQPEIVAPALNLHPEGAPPWMPFLFVTIACGAISGFHGLVSSGTTAKQLNRMPDARTIGYGAMLGEGSLALMATLACTAGFAELDAWTAHYHSWGAAAGLGAKLSAFVGGTSKFMATLGIPVDVAENVVVVLIIAFAATSLDTATRIQRYVLAELGGAYDIRLLQNRYVGGLIAAGSGLGLAMLKGGGQGGLILWPLFGTTNQLIGGMSLLVMSVYLYKKRWPVRYTLLPMLFVVGATTASMIGNLTSFYSRGDWLLTSLSSLILVLELWMIVETVRIYRDASSGLSPASPAPVS